MDEIYVCDPQENALISQNALGERPSGLQSVRPALPRHALGSRWPPEQKIKATFRRWEVLDVKGVRLYHPDRRDTYLGRLTHQSIESQLRNLYQVLNAALAAQKEARKQLIRLGGRYPETGQLPEDAGRRPDWVPPLPGAFIQTPHRFSGGAEALALLPARDPQPQLRRQTAGLRRVGPYRA